jgi:hypothetical protein
VLRAIDPAVVELFLRTEVSGNGGDNNTSGGVTHTSAAALGSPKQPGSITLLIEHLEARALPQAGWRLNGPNVAATLMKHNTHRSGLNSGTYILEMVELPGFEPPPQAYLVAEAGVANAYTFTYVPSPTPLEKWRQQHFGTKNPTGLAADSADPDGDGQSNLAEFAAGTNPYRETDFLKILTAQKTGGAFTVTADGKSGRTYVLPRRLNLSTGTWDTVVTIGPFTAAQTLILTDLNAPMQNTFYPIQVSKQ